MPKLNDKGEEGQGPSTSQEALSTQEWGAGENEGGDKGTGGESNFDFAPTPPSPDAPASPSTPSVDEVMDALNFDPFAESTEQADVGADQGLPDGGQGAGENPPPAQPGEDAAGEQPNQQGAGEQSEGQQTPPPLPPTGEANAELTQLRELVKQQGQIIQQIQGQAGQAGQQAQQVPPAAQDESKELAQLYSLQVPPQVMQGLSSDDAGESQQAMQQLIQGIGTVIHKNLRKEFKETLEKQVPHMISLQQGQKSEQDQIRQDFYGAYSQLDKPELHTIVQATAAQVSDEIGATKWTPELRDMIAQRVLGTIGGLVDGGQGQGQGQPASPPTPPRQPWQANGSTPRGPRGPRDPNSSVAISDTLGF